MVEYIGVQNCGLDERVGDGGRYCEEALVDVREELLLSLGF